jgi:AraC-like DNA-binding protein
MPIQAQVLRRITNGIHGVKIKSTLNAVNLAWEIIMLIDQMKLTEFLLIEEPEWPGNVINYANYVDEIPLEEEKNPGQSWSYEDMSIDEIAAELGVSNRTVIRIIQSAFEKLRCHPFLKDMIHCTEDQIHFEGVACQFIESLLRQ